MFVQREITVPMTSWLADWCKDCFAEGEKSKECTSMCPKCDALHARHAGASAPAALCCPILAAS